MQRAAVSILNEIEQRIDEVRKKKYSVTLIGRSMFVLGGTIGSFCILTLAEALGNFDHTSRTALVLFGSVSFAVITGWFVVQPLLRRFRVLMPETDESVAQWVGKFFPQLQDRLLNVYQLSHKSAEVSLLYSHELLDAISKDFLKELQPIDLLDSVDRSIISRARKWLLIVLSSGTLVFAMFPLTFSAAVYRLSHFTKDFTPPPLYSFQIFPGNREVVKNDSVEITIRVVPTSATFRKTPTVLKLFTQQEKQENVDEQTLNQDSIGIFRTVLPGIRSTTEYFARCNGVESDRYTLTVLDRPIIRSFRVRLEFPGYAKLSPRVQDDFMGDITALYGTRATLTGTASKPLGKAFLNFQDSTKVPISTHGDRFTVSFPIRRNGSYYPSLYDEDGLTNVNPVQYQIHVVADENPAISIIDPGRNLDIANNQTLVLRMVAKDDFGFSSLRIGYRLVKSRFERPQSEYRYTTIPITTTENIADISYTWSLSAMNLVPEDEVEYFAEVFDNDNVSGPKSGRSNLYLLRLPSLEEVFSDVGKEHEQSLDELKETLEDAQKLKNDIESINRDLKNNKDPDWQTKKKMGEMAKKYEDVQKKLEDVQTRLDQMTQQMQQQNVLSPETLEKYMELQQLFQQMNASELQKALQRMQQSMQNISKEQLQQAMQQLTFNEEQFRENIERTIDLLKRMHIEQKLDEVKKRAEALEQEQKELEKETSSAQNDAQKRKELVQQQSELAKKEQAMEREAADLQRRMEEFFTEMPADKMQQLVQQMNKQKVDEKMKQASAQMEQGHPREAQQMQQEAQQHLQDFSQQLDAMQQQMYQKQAQYIMNEMRKATNNLLELSKKEEDLKNESKSAPAESPRLRQNAQDQLRAIQDLMNVTESLNDLSHKSFTVTPEMGKAVGEASAHMNDAMKNLEYRNGTQASQDQENAMAALNKAAIQFQDALQSMMQGGGSGAGSLMQQLQRMAGQQMSINIQTQQMEGMARAQEAAKLAQEQEAVRKSLDQLNQEAQQSSERQRLLGDLSKITDDMKEVVRNLEQNDVNPETIKKQERILSRLLDATKSVHERDYEKKRKSKTGTEIVRKGPESIDLDKLNNAGKYQEDLLKALEQGYSKDYQELIKKYFEALEKSEKPLN